MEGEITPPPELPRDDASAAATPDAIRAVLEGAGVVPIPPLNGEIPPAAVVILHADDGRAEEGRAEEGRADEEAEAIVDELITPAERNEPEMRGPESPEQRLFRELSEGDDEETPELLLEHLSLTAALAIYFGAFGPFAFAFAALLPATGAVLTFPQWWPPFVLAWTACFLGTSLAMYAQALAGFAQPKLRPEALWTAFVLAAAIFTGSTWWMREQGLYNDPSWILVNTVALLACANALGFAIAREIQQSGHLIAVALVGLTVDLWSVYQGPSKEIAAAVIDQVEAGVYQGEVAPSWISFLLLRFPVPGSPEIQAMMGVGDLVFLAFFFGCVVRFGLNPMRNFIGLTLGIVGTLLLVNILHEAFAIPAIPALPILAPLFILLNVTQLRMDAREWRVTLLFVGLLVMLIAAVTAVRLLTGSA